jgi:pyridinium-3,5-bisthiocarboxylic acid mononucleotide nickel chelatase
LIGAVLLRETGSLGLRGTELRRWPQQRTERQVVIDGHVIRAKVALGRVKVEYDDAAAAVAALGRPLRDVLAEATTLAERDVQ